MRRVLSWKRLLIVLGVFVLLAGTSFAVNRIQVRRQVAVLKERAARVEQLAAADPARRDEAIDLYRDYLRFRPDDREAFARYADLSFARVKADPKRTAATIDAAEKFLRQFPDNPAERRKLIDLYMKVGPLVSAKSHINILFDSVRGSEFRHDPNLLEQAANCAIAEGDVGLAVTYLDDAIATAKAPSRVFEVLLDTLHDNPSFRDPRYTSSKYLEVMCNQEPYKSDIDIRIAAGRALMIRGDLPEARKQIARAREMPGGATHAEALIAAAEMDLAEITTPESIVGQLKKAQAHLETAVKADPKNVRAGLRLADVLARQGELRRAIDVLKSTAEALGETNDQFTHLVDRLLDLGEQDLSARLIDRIDANEADRVRVGKYLRGRLALVKGEWGQARTLLEEAVPTLTRVPELHKRAAAGLGRCYEAFQNPDKQLEFSRSALKDDALYLPAVIGEADALVKLGRSREALSRYVTIVNGYKIETYRPTLARLELRAALTQPPDSRNWEAFDKSLGPVEGRAPELQIIHAESLIARDQGTKAAEVLESLVRANPGNAAAWLALARLQGVKSDAILTTLNGAEAKVGDTVELRLARAVVAVNRAKTPNPGDLKRLAVSGEKFPKPDQRRLWYGLGDAAMRAAYLVPDPDAAEFRTLAIDYYRRAAALDPLDLTARAVLIDLGLMADRRDVVDATLAEITAPGAEGPNGPIGSLARVIIRVPDVRKIEDKAARAAAMKELRDLANRAKSERPGWSRVYVVLAQLDEMDGLNDSALANYLEAIGKGERLGSVLRRAVELYRERRQDDQALALLNQYHTEIVLPDDLERFRVVSNLLRADIPKSERPTIDRIAPAAAKDHRLLLLRGALLSAIGDEADALAAFHAAVALRDNVPETWTALVAHLARQGKLEAAKAAVAEAEGKLKNNPPPTDAGKAEMLVALAGCYEFIGDAKTADARYRDAVATAPRELKPNRELARFLQRSGNDKEADALLRKLADEPAQDLARWARRQLALTIVAREEGYQQRAIALGLIDRNVKVSENDPEDLKARAVVLTVDPATRDEGIKALKDFAKWGDLTPDEFYLLARLHFDQGGDHVFESVTYFEKAAWPRPGVTAEHMAGLVRLYLAIKKPEFARRAMDRLKAIYPQSWEAVREEARLKHWFAADAEKTGRGDEGKKLDAEARDLILKHPGAMAERAVAGRTGPLLEELGFHSDAEAAYRRLLAEGKQPGRHFPLAVFLIGQKRTADAIDLALKNQDPDLVVLTARVMTGAVRTRRPGPDAEKKVEAWLAGRLREAAGTPQFAPLLAARAELLEAQGSYDEAIAAYAEALKHGRSPVAVNNLCMLLAMKRPERIDEAIALMNDLIAVRTAAPAFLDTRAVVLIVKGGRTAEAVKDLELANLQQERAVYRYHLAWAYHLTPGQTAKRDVELDRARQLGLKVEDLHPLEAPRYRELTQK